MIPPDRGHVDGNMLLRANTWAFLEQGVVMLEVEPERRAGEHIWDDMRLQELTDHSHVLSPIHPKLAITRNQEYRYRVGSILQI